MLKRIGVKKIYTIVLLCIGIMIFFSIKNMVSANTINLKIEMSPASGFLKAENLAPGDTESRILKVNNAGDTRFAYKVSSRMEDGSEDLFNLLRLKIEQGDTFITETNLNDLSNLPLGELAVNSFSEFTFSVHFPVDSGNEYQGLFTKVAFDFIATAEGGEIKPPDKDNDGDPPDHRNPPDQKDPPNQPDNPDDTPKLEEPSQPDDPTDPEDQPDEIIEIPTPEVPASGIELPKTSSPWFNLLLISGIFIALSILLLALALKIDRSKKWDI